MPSTGFTVIMVVPRQITIPKVRCSPFSSYGSSSSTSNCDQNTNHAYIRRLRRERCSSRNRIPLIYPRLLSNSVMPQKRTFATPLHLDSQRLFLILFQIDNELSLRLDVISVNECPPFPRFFISLFERNSPLGRNPDHLSFLSFFSFLSFLQQTINNQITEVRWFDRY